MQPGEPRVLVIVGPTAAGKSALAERLAGVLPADLVSADASQVYRGLDVGTAKPTPRDRVRHRYHGIDLRSPTRRCTAGAYARWARHRLRTISAAGRLPILVGGSGFYVQATMGGLDRLPSSRPAFREGLQRWAEAAGLARLHGALAVLDPAWSADLDPNDRQRVIRALEVVLRTGRRRAQLRASRGSTARPLQADTLWVGLDWNRAELARRIEARVDEMLGTGWIDEVRCLLDAGVEADSHALQAIGYRQLVEHLRGGLPLDQAREQIVDATRRYAKRQMTWCRRWPHVRWWRIERAADIPHVHDAVEAAAGDWYQC